MAMCPTLATAVSLRRARYQPVISDRILDAREGSPTLSTGWRRQRPRAGVCARSVIV
jgi:hypothetical protein